MALNFPSNPSVNDTYSFNGKTWTWNGSGWQLNSTVGQSLTLSGNVTAGNILTDNYFYANGDAFVSSNYGNTEVQTYLGNISGNLIPSANVTYNLGSETQRWNTIYLAGNTINLGGAQIKADPDAGTITILPVLSTGGSSTTQALIISNTGIVTAETDSNGNISTASILAATANATNLSSSVVGGGGGVSTVQTVIRSMIFGGG